MNEVEKGIRNELKIAEVIAILFIEIAIILVAVLYFTFIVTAMVVIVTGLIGGILIVLIIWPEMGSRINKWILDYVFREFNNDW